MAYFPFMVDIKGMNGLVVGGGRIALHKVQILQDFEAHISVVAPEICEEMKVRNFKNVQYAEREFQDADVEGMDFVIAATDQEMLNYHVSDLCRQRNIPVNAVDMKEACSFIFPGILRNRDLLIAVSSGGQSPAAVSFVKDKIRGSVPEYYGEMIETLGGYRDYILEHVDSPEKRKRLFYQLLEYGDDHAGEIPEKLLYRLVREL